MNLKRFNGNKHCSGSEALLQSRIRLQLSGRHYTMISRLFIMFILAASPGIPLYGQSGRQFFEEAYRLESSDPEKSVELYKKALSSGLDQKMRNAAQWRLFHLYRSQKKYAEAYLLLPGLGSGQGTAAVRSELMNEMLFTWKISQTALDHYLNAITSLSAGRQDYGRHFSSAMAASPGNIVFHREIAQRLIEYGKTQEAFSLIRQNDNQAPAAVLLEADHLISQGKSEEAEKLLRKASMNYVLSPKGTEYIQGPAASLNQNDRFTLLYLLARIHRDNGNLYESTVYYRLAAQYASEEEQRKQISLAAFGLYKNGYPLQAYLLIMRLPLSDDFNVRLLQLLLRTEVAGDTESLRALGRMESEIRLQRLKGNDSFLIERALRIISSSGGKGG